MGGVDLGRLRDAVERELLTLDEREQSVRSVMARLETGFLRRCASFQHD
jgi:F-type H+-transporting ATPase subunit epsilon